MIEIDEVFVARIAVAGQDAVESAKDFGFQIEAFGGGFNGNVRAGERLHVDGGVDAAEGGLDFGFGELAFGSFAAEVGADGGEGAIEKSLFHIAQRDLKAGPGEYMGDARAHGSRADYGGLLNLLHVQTSRARGSVAG